MSRCGRGRGLLREETPPASAYTTFGSQIQLTASSECSTSSAKVPRALPSERVQEPEPRVVEARVTQILDPGNFWAQLGSAHDLSKFDGLIDELCTWCNEKGKGVDVFPKVGTLVAVKGGYSGTGAGAEETWTRANVTRLVPDNQEKEVEVFYVDTGYSGRISLMDVCSAPPPMLYGSPFQALQCTLQDVTLPHGVESWSQDATAHFAVLVSGPSAQTKAIVHCIKDNCFSVTLYTLFDGHWMSVGEILKQQGIALYSPSGPITIDHLVDGEKRETVHSHSIDKEHLTTITTKAQSESTPLDITTPTKSSRDGGTLSPRETPYTSIEISHKENNKTHIEIDLDNSPPPLIQPKKKSVDHEHDDMPPLTVVPPLKQLLEQQFAVSGVSNVMLKEEDPAVIDVKCIEAPAEEWKGKTRDLESSEARSGSVTPLAVTLPEPTAKPSAHSEKSGEQTKVAGSSKSLHRDGSATSDQTDASSVSVKEQRKGPSVASDPVHSGTTSSDDVFQSDGDTLSSNDEWDESLLPPSTHSESSEATPQLSPAKPNDVSGHHDSAGSAGRRNLQDTFQLADMIYDANQHKYPKRPPRKQNGWKNASAGNKRGNLDKSPPYRSRSQEPFKDSAVGRGSRHQIREGSFQDRGSGSTGMGRGNWLSDDREKLSTVGKMTGVQVMQRQSRMRPPGGRGTPRHHKTLQLKQQYQQQEQQFQQDQSNDAGTSVSEHAPQPRLSPSRTTQDTVITGLSKDEVINEANWHIFNIEKELKQDFKNLSTDNVQAFGFRVDNILQGKNALSLLSLPTPDDPLEVIFSCILEETVSSRLDKINLDVVTAALTSVVKTVIGDQIYQKLQSVVDKKAQEVSQDSHATDAGRRRHMFCSLLGKLFIAASFSECEEYHSSVGRSVQKCLNKWTKFTPSQPESHRYAYADCLRALCEEIGPAMDATKMESLDAYFDGPIMELMLSEPQPRAVREILIKLSLKRARKWDGKKVVYPPSLMGTVQQHQAQNQTDLGLSRFSQEAPSPAANVVQPIPLSAPPESQQLVHAQEPTPIMSPSLTAFLPMHHTLRSQSVGTPEQVPPIVLPSRISRSQSDSCTESPYTQVYKMLEELQLLVLFPQFKKSMLTDHLLECDDVSTLKGCLQDSGIPAGAVYRIIEYTKKSNQIAMSQVQTPVDPDLSSPARHFTHSTSSVESTIPGEKITPYQMHVEGPSVQPHQFGQVPYSPDVRQLSSRPSSVQTPGRYMPTKQQASSFSSSFQSSSLSPVASSRTVSALPPTQQQANRQEATPYPSGLATPVRSVVFPGPMLPSNTSQHYTSQQKQPSSLSQQHSNVVEAETESETVSQSHSASYQSQMGGGDPSVYQQTTEYKVASYSSPSTAQRKLTIISSAVNTPRQAGSTLPRESEITVRLPHSPKQPQTGQTQDEPKKGGFGTVNCLLCGSNSHTTPSCNDRGNFFFH